MTEYTCLKCHGNGWIKIGDIDKQIPVICTSCNGTGKVRIGE